MEKRIDIQKKKNIRLNKLTIIIALSLFFILIILCSYYIPSGFEFTRNIENTSIKWRFTSKAFTKVETVGGTLKTQAGTGFYKRIFIAQIDELSKNKFGGSLKIDRKVWAGILNHFNTLPEEQLPEIVLFDLYFNEISPDPLSDTDFTNALVNYKGAVGNTIKLDLVQDRSLRAKEMLDYNSAVVQNMKRFELNIDPSIEISNYTKITAPIPAISESLGFIGTINMDNDGELYRKEPLIMGVTYYFVDNGKINLTNVFYPSAALAMSVKLLKSDISNIIIGKNDIIIRNSVYNGRKEDFRIPVDSQYRLSVNYKAAPETGYLKSLAVKDIERAGLPRNPIILVGIYITGLAPNDWLSPLGTMNGTDHLAYALGTIMNRDFLINVPDWINILYVVLFTLLIGYLLSKGIRTTIIAFVLSFVIPLILGFGLFRFNIEILTLLPIIISILVLVTGEVYIILTEEREKRFIKTTFSKYVNPDLVNILIQNPDMLQLGGQEKDLTILFSDIRSFTTLSEGMTAGELISFLNIYLTKMTDIVMETQGTLDKYIGDAVVAFWGTPIELENHALNACKASIKMMKALKDFNDEQARLGHKPINIGIGLNSGNLTVGNVGSEKKKNYTAIGDNATLAEDLQDENKLYKTNIIISENTYERTKDSIVVRELDSIYVKGKEAPMKIYELLDVLES